MMNTENATDYFSLDVERLKLINNNGYLCFYNRDHPLAGKSNGLVAVHRHVMSVHLGRWLGPEEMVTFLNGNRQDIRVENLEVVSRAELLKRAVNSPPPVELVCPRCNKLFKEVRSHAPRRRYCSQECAKAARQKFDVSPEELERLVWKMSTVKVAEMFGVSDKAIEKRCKKFGIQKPPPGYWAKRYAGHIDPAEVEEGKSQTLEE